MGSLIGLLACRRKMHDCGIQSCEQEAHRAGHAQQRTGHASVTGEPSKAPSALVPAAMPPAAPSAAFCRIMPCTRHADRGEDLAAPLTRQGVATLGHCRP